MAVGFEGLMQLFPVRGFRIGIASAGIKKPGRRDVVVMELAPGATCAGMFTRNAFCAAPVTIAKQHLAAATPRYFLINTGNANAGTGKQGLADAQHSCVELAREAGCTSSEVLPFSTGVIGEPLPLGKITQVLPHALADLREGNWEDAAHGIMTTDTVPKGCSRRVALSSGEITITGIAKGSGMIRPDMATMLSYIATDAGVAQAALQRALDAAVNQSFNRITVDGDTSTNDACMLVATGASGVHLAADSADFQIFCQVLREVCEFLAQAIVRDGEGATKLITIDVVNGRDITECEQVAFTIAHSPLVKTAFFASDPNWGRILAAVGRAGVPELNLDAITIHLGDVCIVREGGRAADYTEERGAAVMAEAEIAIRVDLARGDAMARVWTCDFSYDYVRINAEYRS
ncbi:MAG: bifunctional ornithine acetyltransferase/N-acetylglutamate synthase [Gammaproteobacteria bacterium HGW-Gammaproteobacteria-1]|jgi:glutamate N-acetyltransferase/amino-acid N-acetyltransferase|nr:MAG: bifunctional ornithine acetyltransferase/N-acetylglutamate synthase [Gammaproteobacteria bacterium HGW-Gammaproteobacteria-1]